MRPRVHPAVATLPPVPEAVSLWHGYPPCPGGDKDSDPMLLIPTYVGPSAIHGFGLFTAAPIPANTVIWQFVDGVDLRLTEADLLALPVHLRGPLKSYCYREASGAYVLCGDNAKFMNHSTRPSCDDDGVATVVPKALPAGAELTCDYRAFDYDTINGRGEWFTAAEGRPLGQGA